MRHFLFSTTSAICLAMMAWSVCGCYAPMRSPGVSASRLPDEFRTPIRTAAPHLNLGQLVAEMPGHYLLGPGDQLSVLVPDLDGERETKPFAVVVQENGLISLPRVGVLYIAGRSVVEAQSELNQKLVERGILVRPSATISLVARGTVKVMVLGEVARPGVYELPRYENDIAHALASAGGFTEYADERLEVHRSPKPGDATLIPSTNPTGWGHPQPLPTPRGLGTDFPIRGVSHQSPVPSSNGFGFGTPEITARSPLPIERIDMRDGFGVAPSQRLLSSGDIVKVPKRAAEVFYVVGPLSEINRVRFNVGDRDREIGNGFLLPPDREVDTVTAVAMAGYIDPINSPTSVTVHRSLPDGSPLLIRVDLIRAREEFRENVLIQPGDIIYLNPDAKWWWRRTFNGMINTVLGRVVPAR